MNERWYDKTVAQVAEKLNTDVNAGLSPQVLRTRQKNDEMNVIYPVKKHSFESCLKKIITDPTTLLLLIISFLAAIFESDSVAWFVIGLTIFNVIISVFTYNKALKIFEDMSKLSLPTTKVMRNGKMYLIKSEQLVKGDLIYLSSGDMVPADARIVESDGFQVLEVNITGEIKPTEKDPYFLKYTHDVPPGQQANMVFASTIVIKGTAKAICCCTGDDTLVRKMEKTKPLVSYDNIRPIAFMTKYSKVWGLGLIGAIFVLVILMVMFGPVETSFLSIFLSALAFAVASNAEFHLISAYIIVANGLFSAVKQNKHINSGALIKNISKIDQLKDITCLLVNKDGAFSIREVKAEKVFVNHSLYSEGEVHFSENVERALKFAIVSTGLYGAGNLINKNLNNENIFSPEEDAIISLAQRCRVYNINLDREYPILEHISKGEISRFDTTLVNSENGYTVACRGTLEDILSACTSYSENGKVYLFDSEKKSEIISEALKLGRKCYRIVAIASKSTHYNNLRRISACQTDMVFEGFVAIKEKMLPGAARNIAACQAAGIKVIMLSDDLGDNNRILAESLGIVKNEDEIVTGAQLLTMKEDLIRTNVSLYKLYENLSIFQKRKLLANLHSEGEVVGVLARELDEIILLKEADVGFLQSTTLSGKLEKGGLDMTMAKNTNTPMLVKNSKDSKKTGSEALKFIADVIVSDADKRGNGGFNAMLGAIVASKKIYSSLAVFVKYLLTTNFARFLILLYTIFARDVVIKPQQILFTGLVIDFLAMLFITFDRKDYRIVLKKNSVEELNDFYKYIPIALLSGIVWAGSVIVLPMLLGILNIHSVSVQTTALFVGFIISQVVVINELIKDDSIFKFGAKYKRAQLLLIVTVVGFLLVTYFWKPAQEIFCVVRMGWMSYLLSLIPSVTMLIVYEVQKIFLKK